MKFGSEIAKARKDAQKALSEIIAEAAESTGEQFAPTDGDWRSGPIGMGSPHTDGYTKDIGELPPGVSE